jgi:hypothetical protein
MYPDLAGSELRHEIDQIKSTRSTRHPATYVRDLQHLFTTAEETHGTKMVIVLE